MILKLYIDSTSLSLVPQAADFVQCADDADTAKVITWLRVTLGEKQIEGRQAVYLPQMAAVSAEFIQAVIGLANEHPFRLVEIHSNQVHSWRGVLPLLRHLLPVLDAKGAQLRLHLYDDGSLSLLQRETLKAQADLPGALARAAAQLRGVLRERASLQQWTVLHSHAWHLAVDTTYHMLRRDILRRDERGAEVAACFDGVARDMRLDVFGELDARQQAMYLDLFGVDETTRRRLGAVAADERSFLFTGTGAFDKPINDRLGQAQLRTIAKLHAQEMFPSGGPMCFKAHPANSAYTSALCAALGEGTIELPPQVPLEVLMSAGCLPANLGGVLSTLHLTLPAQRVRFAVCDAKTKREALELPLVRLMIEGGCLEREKVLPWLN